MPVIKYCIWDVGTEALIIFIDDINSFNNTLDQSDQNLRLYILYNAKEYNLSFVYSRSRIAIILLFVFSSNLKSNRSVSRSPSDIA